MCVCFVCRIPYHQDDITKSLVRLVSDCCQQDGSLPKPKSPGKLRTRLLCHYDYSLNTLESRMINGVIKCLIILQRCCPLIKVCPVFRDLVTI